MNTGKNIFILGDSYSTYRGHIPEGYSSFYSDERTDEPVVDAVQKTWWKKLIEKMNYNLLVNDSFSGSTICNTGYDGYCPDTSFVGRLDKYIKDNYFINNKIDTIFVFGGTNDSWAGSPIGELKYSDFSEDDLKCALPAFCYLLHRIKENVKNSRIVVIINSELNPAIAENYIVACKKFEVEYVELTEIDKIDGHPTVLGMEQISNQVRDCLMES